MALASFSHCSHAGGSEGASALAPWPRFTIAHHQLVQERQGMQQTVGELATNVLFANYNIHLALKYFDS